jgi:hypothetical protein
MAITTNSSMRVKPFVLRMISSLLLKKILSR